MKWPLPKKVDEGKINSWQVRLREWQAGSEREYRKVHNSTEGTDGSQAQGQILIFEEQNIWEYSDQGPLFWPIFA